MNVTLNVNGVSTTVDVDIEMPLLWVLRDRLGLTGTKYGCGISVCHACTVLLDGAPIKSCDLKASEVKGRKIKTIEGLSPDRSHPVQQAWIEEQVPQCGWCQSGMILACAALVDKGSSPTDASINAINNLCVCGTYNRIRAGVQTAVAIKKGS